MACIKCGVPLVKEDRGNIQLGNPDGFEHIDCSKTKYISKEMAKKEFPILPTEPVKEKDEEVIPEYTPPVKKEEKIEEVEAVVKNTIVWRKPIKNREAIVEAKDEEDSQEDSEGS